MPSIDEIDRQILNDIQLNFPVSSRPFRLIAGRLSLTEQEVIDRVRHLKKTGIIRRIGGNFSPDRLGYFSTLCAASVPEEKIDCFKTAVNAYPGVTHNYLREHEFNVWFTFIAPKRSTIKKNLEDIARKTGVSNILNLPATRVFKISANFKL